MSKTASTIEKIRALLEAYEAELIKQYHDLDERNDPATDNKLADIALVQTVLMDLETMEIEAHESHL